MEHSRDPVAEPAALPSLGRTSAQMLVEAGVQDVSALRRLGPLECYRLLRFHHGKRVTTNFAYALECASREINWRRLEPERKAELKRQAKAIADEFARVSR